MSSQGKKNSQKQEKIVEMFDDIAPTYDTANRVMSMGIDKSWRKKACDLSYQFLAKDSVGTIVDPVELEIRWSFGVIVLKN